MKLNKMFLTFSAMLSVNLSFADIKENNHRNNQEIVYSSIAVDMEKNRIIPQQVFSTKNGVILTSIKNEFYRKDNSEQWKKIGGIDLNSDEKIIDIIYDKSLLLLLTNQGRLLWLRLNEKENLNNFTLVGTEIKKIALIDNELILLKANSLSWNTYIIEGDSIILREISTVEATDAYIKNNSVYYIVKHDSNKYKNLYFGFLHNAKNNHRFINSMQNILNSIVKPDTGTFLLNHIISDLSQVKDIIWYNDTIYILKNNGELVSGNANFKTIYNFHSLITKGQIDLREISDKDGKLKNELVIEVNNKYYIYDLEEKIMEHINFTSPNIVKDSVMSDDGIITYISEGKVLKETKIFEAFNKANYPCFIFNDITNLPIGINPDTKLRCSVDVRLAPSNNISDTRVYANGVNQFPLSLSYQVKQGGEIQALPLRHSNLVNTNKLYLKNEYNDPILLDVIVDPTKSIGTSPAYSLVRNDFNLGVYNPSGRSERKSRANLSSNVGEKQFYFMVPESNYIHTHQKYSLCTKQPGQDRNFNTCASQVDITAIPPLKIQHMTTNYTYEPDSANIFVSSRSVYEFIPNSNVPLYKVIAKSYGNHSHDFTADIKPGESSKNPSLLAEGYTTSTIQVDFGRRGNATLTIPGSLAGGNSEVYLGKMPSLLSSYWYTGEGTPPIDKKSKYLVWVGISMYGQGYFPSAHMTVDNVRVDLQDMHGNITRGLALNNGGKLRI